MNYRERMKEYLKESDEYSSQYGKWGILNKEQRDLIKRLLREMDSADEVIKHQFFEIERLNNIINELKEWFKGYHKSYASCKWYEEDYIEFIEHLENELKGSSNNE